MPAGAKNHHIHIHDYRTILPPDLTLRQDKLPREAYKPFVSTDRLEHILRNLDEVATRIGVTPSRQIWRFELDGRGYLLQFYPRHARGMRLMRRNESQQEFFGLQTLQKASIPSPRAIAFLSGCTVAGVLGDAVIIEAIEPAKVLEELLIDLHLNGEPVPARRQLALHVRTILHQLGRAGLGHDGLTLSSFLVSGNRVCLRDGAGLTRGGMRERQVMILAHDASRFATASELRRAWDLLMPGTEIPLRNRQSPRLWRAFLRGIFLANASFGTVRIGRWKGVFSKRSRHARRWAVSSRLDVTQEEWQRVWPTLLRQIEQGRLEYLKRDPSGEVMSAQITLAGKSIPVIIKRPRRKFWYRYVVDLGRAARARRMWKKAWQVIVRDLPTEWPMLLMEKRRLGYVTDGVIIFERVPGVTLARLDLDSLSSNNRETLFRRAGTVLRKLEQRGLTHYDAKSANWMVMSDDKLGPVPIMIDLDGIRPLTWKLTTFGIRRLLRAMRLHPQYSVADSLALCRGFAPFSPIRPEEQKPDLDSRIPREEELTKSE